jgi:PAS domain S-box-containing protein
MEYRLGHHSGKYRWISDRGTPRYADDGTFLGYIGACSDIQEEKDARDALKESEARFRVLAEDSPLPLMLHRDGRFIYLNAAALHLFRAGDESELVGQSVFDRIVPENQVSARERMRKVTEGGGEPVTFEQRFVTLEGAVVDVAVVGRMVSYDGLPAALAFAQDITGRKRLEESELRAKKAESLVLMAGSIAHDFNNLFQALLTSLELAEYKAKQAPEIARPLAAAKDVLRRAVVLSWKMLDFSGRAIARLERVDLAVLVDGWAAELGQQLGGAPRLELDLGSVPKVNADPEQLNKVLSSIFINAREAMDESGLLDGRVRLKLFVDFGEDRPINQTEGVWVVEPPEGPATVCLEIANDGPTPGPEVLSRMFDPFFTTKALGRGLGLASALGLLQAHRAGIHVLSGPGKGLVFRIHFPPAGA